MKQIRVVHLLENATARVVLRFRAFGRRLCIVVVGSSRLYSCTDYATGMRIGKCDDIDGRTPRECLRRVSRWLNTPKVRSVQMAPRGMSFHNLKNRNAERINP